jgi:hypothetical protein
MSDNFFPISESVIAVLQSAAVLPPNITDGCSISAVAALSRIDEYYSLTHSLMMQCIASLRDIWLIAAGGASATQHFESDHLTSAAHHHLHSEFAHNSSGTKSHLQSGINAIAVRSGLDTRATHACELESRILLLQAYIQDSKVQLTAAASSFAQSLSGVATVQSSASNSLAMNCVDATSSVLKCSASVSAGVRRRDSKFLRAIFDRHKDSASSLSASKLTAALTEIDAPIIPDSDGAALAMIAQFDSNSNGTMEFGEFVSAVNVPDELALYYKEKQQPALADALRALVGRGSDQLLRVSLLSRDHVLAASAAVQASLEEQATSLHEELQSSFAEQFEIYAQMEIDAGKFNVLNMACGGIMDFHKGLAGRVGMPHLGFRDAMKQEHCERAGCDTLFTTGNYKIATTPRQEWLYIAGNDEGQRKLCPDMGHGRRIPSISELMKLKLAIDAKLTEVEMLAIVLYTGPMFQVSELGLITFEQIMQ